MMMGSHPISLDIGLVLYVLRTRPNTAQTRPIYSDTGQLVKIYKLCISYEHIM